MKRSTLSWATLPVAAVLVTALVPTATANAAATGKAGVAQAKVASHAKASSKSGGLLPAAISSYQQVSSALLTDPAGSQVSGDVSCPAHTKVVSGGAVISSSSLSENLNGSIPLSKSTWRVYVNNASATAGTFRVYAVCATAIKGYSQVIGTGVSNATGTQVAATATCPTGRVPLGGGGVGSSLNTTANLNSSIPLSNGWRADVNNNSGSTQTATAYVVCATAPGKYVQVTATTATTVNAGAQASSIASCPARTSLLGGGGFSSSGSVLVNLNSTLPISSTSWQSYENNSSTSTSNLTAYAVCGKAVA